MPGIREVGVNQYEVWDAAGLDVWADLVRRGNSNASCKLLADIAYDSPKEWVPIGNGELLYSGTFDGNGHTIGGLWEKTVGDSGNYFALFRQVGGEVCNLNVSIDITISGESAGNSFGAAGIAIYIMEGTITGCTYSGNLTVKTTWTDEPSYICVGGIAAELSSRGTISSCAFNGTIDATGLTIGNKYIGGIVGRNTGGTLSDDNKDTGTINQ